jgi:hypothetical protein
VSPFKRITATPSALQKISHERIGRGLAGSSIILFCLLGIFVHPYFHLFNLLISLNLLQSAFTDKCLIKSTLISLGFPGERELGKRDGTHSLKGKNTLHHSANPKTGD